MGATDYGTVSDFTLTIAAGATSGTATFSLVPTNDDVDEDAETLTVGGNTTAQGLTIAGDEVTITDDDERGVAVSRSSLTVSEGSTGSYTVVLRSQPTGSVTVTPSVTDNADVEVSPASLSFTAGNWSTAQTVTVSADQDADAEDDTATVEHEVSCGDYGSNGVTADDVSVTVTDDETAATRVTLEAAPSSVSEDGGSATVTVTGRLNGAPRTSDTAVTVSVGATGDGAVEGTDYGTVSDFTLTIAAGATSGTATFSLVPTDDRFGEGAETLTVGGNTTGQGLTITGDEVTITDDDERGVAVSRSSLTVSEGSTGSYTVVLRSQPTGSVTVTPSVTDNADVEVSPASLSFTAGNWSTAQTLTVTAGQDADAEDDTATVEHEVSGGVYGTETADDVAVTVTDDETVSTQEIDPSSVSEDGGPAIVTDDDPAVPGVPQVGHVTVTPDPVSSTGLVVEWGRAFVHVGESRRPSDYVEITQYEVEYAVEQGHWPYRVDGEDWETVTYPRWIASMTWVTWNGTIEALDGLGPVWYRARLTGLTEGEMYRVRVRAAPNQDDLGPWSWVRPGTPRDPAALGATETGPLTAEVQGAPQSHDGMEPFAFRLQFSEAVDTGFRDMRDHALSVNGGTVTQAKRVDRRDDLWEIEVTPSGTQSVSILILPTTDCAVAGAICTSDGRMLTTAPGLSIPYAPALAQGRSQPAALTAAFSDVPEEHDGSTPFALDLTFSEEPHDVGFRTVRDGLFTVTGGAIRVAKRLEKPLNRLYRLTVAPDGNDDVSLTLATPLPACGTAGAVCTADERALTGPLTATILGPPGLAVADAAVDEGPGAALAFAVTLDRAASGTVTVDYATSDGTATEGEDYTETNGTLTFAAGETSKTVSVPVLEDAHDEGDETLTLTLSNPSGAYLEDATATGTIRNTDLMPQAWLARFGRTVADQVIDAVAGRLMASPAPGVALSVAGERIGGGAAAVDELDAHEAESRLAALSTWFRGEEERESAHGFRSRAVTEREILTGTSFAFTEGSAETGFVGLWGRGAVSRFDGREGALRLDGEAESAMLGADWTGARGTAGLVLSHSRGEGGYRSAQGGGAVSSTLTGVYPYGRYDVSDRLSLWGIVGLGQGTLTLTPEGMDPIETDMDLTMAALGGRGVLVEAPATGGIELAATSDAMTVQTTTGEVRGSAGSLAASEADVTRLRLGLEGTWRGLGSIVPSFEIGVRQDEGDAETGFGADIGAGLAWSDPASGLEAAVNVRGLLTHDDGGFRERGFAGSFAWDPGPASGVGPSLTLRHAVGAQASGGMDALLAPEAAHVLTKVNDDEDALGRRTLQARLAYGLLMFGGHYTGAPALGLEMSESGRKYSIGWHFGAAQREDFDFEVRFEASRLDAANDDVAPDHRIGFRMSARW